MSTRDYFDEKNWKKGYRNGYLFEPNAVDNPTLVADVKDDNGRRKQYLTPHALSVLQNLKPFVITHYCGEVQLYFMREQSMLMFKLS